MSGKWTRNQKIAAWSVIVAAFGLVITLFSKKGSSVNQLVGNNNTGNVFQQNNSPNSPITLNPVPTTAEKFLNWADNIDPQIRAVIAAKKAYSFAGLYTLPQLDAIEQIAKDDTRQNNGMERIKIEYPQSLHGGGLVVQGSNMGKNAKITVDPSIFTDTAVKP